MRSWSGVGIRVCEFITAFESPVTAHDQIGVVAQSKIHQALEHSWLQDVIGIDERKVRAIRRIQSCIARRSRSGVILTE
jgi:hypothetical protein